MATLVTGATGFVGSHIVRQLHASGEPVRAMVREHSPLEALAGVPVEKVRGDVRDLASLRAAMRGIDRVIHTAASVRIDPFAPERMAQVNVEGTRNVVAAARESGVKRLLHISSTAAVASGTMDKPADETSTWNFAHKGPYWTTKRASEELVLEAVKRGDIEAVVVNPSYVLGPGEVDVASASILLLIATGLVVVYPDGGQGFVDVRDVARGALLALKKGRTGERYILNAENLTYRQLVTIATEELGLPSPKLPLPRSVAFAAAKVGDIAGRAWSKPFLQLNSDFVGALYDLSYVTSNKAIRELGWQPRSIRESIRDSYAWYRQTGRLRSPLWKRRPAADEHAASASG